MSKGNSKDTLENVVDGKVKGIRETLSLEQRLEIIKKSVENIIYALGDDPKREGLAKTPQRYAKAILEILWGYFADPEEVIGDAIFEQDYSGIVIVRNIKFFSMCEHHLLPFFGNCSIAYIPDGKIIGLSKLPRVVKFFAGRLQVQERLTEDIGKFIENVLKPRGVAIYVSAHHLCLAMRGVKKEGVKMDTVFFSGKFQNDDNLKNFFLKQIREDRKIEI